MFKLENCADGYSKFFNNAREESKQSSSYAWGLRISSIVTGLALTVLAGVAAYYCLVNGFNYLDIATTRFQLFVGGSLAYIGLVMSIASVVNLFCTVGALCRENPGDACECATIQTVGTATAPIVAIPAALCFGFQVAIEGKR